MTKKRSGIFFFFLTIITLCGEIFIIKSFSPAMQFPIFQLTIPIINIFFLLLFICFFSSITFFLRTKLQGLLIATFMVIYLFFRYLNFTNLVYQILLLLIFISIELFFFQKQKEKQ